ncbi:hypothetical protein EBB07_28310 [Paenibacillaceae bacterium]|nr:hypothetical protein EBB07_28310 [Paenibacillaceae bacterium]
MKKYSIFFEVYLKRIIIALIIILLIASYHMVFINYNRLKSSNDELLRITDAQNDLLSLERLEREIHGNNGEISDATLDEFIEVLQNIQKRRSRNE